LIARSERRTVVAQSKGKIEDRRHRPAERLARDALPRQRRRRDDEPVRWKAFEQGANKRARRLRLADRNAVKPDDWFPGIVD